MSDVWTMYEMDLEFTHRTRVDSKEGRLVNMLHTNAEIGRCKEFGFYGMTEDDIRANHGPMPTASEVMEFYNN